MSISSTKTLGPGGVAVSSIDNEEEQAASDEALIAAAGAMAEVSQTIAQNPNLSPDQRKKLVATSFTIAAANHSNETVLMFKTTAAALTVLNLVLKEVNEPQEFALATRLGNINVRRRKELFEEAKSLYQKNEITFEEFEKARKYLQSAEFELRLLQEKGMGPLINIVRRLK